MGGFATVFKGLLGGDPVKGITDIIDQFHMSPDQKAQLGLAQAQLEERREEITAARDEALAELQSKNITAETQSEDPYVRRARPTFLYVIIAGIALDLIVIPLFQAVVALLSSVHGGAAAFNSSVSAIHLIEIPSAYLELFGVAFLGYTGARTWEKTKGVNGNGT